MTDGFLTDQLRRVVEGENAEEMDIKDSTYRDYQARAKNRADHAIDDLIKIAESPTIDHTEVIEPSDITRLLRALKHPTPQYHYQKEEATTFQKENPSHEETLEFKSYKKEIYFELDQLLRDWNN